MTPVDVYNWDVITQSYPKHLPIKMRDQRSVEFPFEQVDFY